MILKYLMTPEEFFNKGKALANAGRSQEALQAFDKAIEIDPELASPGWGRLHGDGTGSRDSAIFMKKSKTTPSSKNNTPII